MEVGVEALDDRQKRLSTDGSLDSFEKDQNNLSESLLDVASPASPGGVAARQGKGGKKRNSSWAHNSQMLSAKDERKRAEYDVQLLANRLAFLRAEERATQKNIVDTKERTRQVQRAKEAAKRHDDAREAHRRQVKAREEANRKYFNDYRRQTKANIKGAQKQTLEQRRKAAERSRKESELLQKQKNDMSEGDNSRRMQSYKTVRAMHEQQSAKAAKQRYDRELKLKKQYESKMSEEKKRKNDAEELIAKFEAEEARLIERLKGTQVAQQSELSKLEKTLISP